MTSKNRYHTVERLALLDFSNDFASGVTDGPNHQATAVRLRHVVKMRIHSSPLFTKNVIINPSPIFLADCCDKI